MSGDSLLLREVIFSMTDDGIPISSISNLLGKHDDSIYKYFEENILSVSCGQPIVSVNGAYFLSETQALSICHHIAPRNYVATSTIQIAFIITDILDTECSLEKIISIVQTLGDFVVTPLGVAAVESAVRELSVT